MIGPNGAGKTTLLSIIAATLEPDSGEVRLDSGRVGFVPQQPALYRKLTVEENLRLFARLERVADLEAAVAEMLEQAGLGERRGDQVGTLSGGNQQRVNIAIGLLAKPAVLLLDEPSTGLDPRQRARLWEFVLGLAGGGTTVIFTTHHIPEAERYGSRLLVLADGEALFDGSPRQLHEAAGDGAAHDFEGAFVSFLHERGHCGSAMRWLLLKDLKLLRRSPLLSALLVIYPIVIAVLIGFALSGGPISRASPSSTRCRPTRPRPRRRGVRHRRRPRRALRPDRVRPGREQGRRPATGHLGRGARRADPARRPDREAAVAGGLTPEQPTVEVLVNEEDPVKGQLVDDRIDSLLSDANLRVSQSISEISVSYLDILLNGGALGFLGQDFEILGLRGAEAILREVRADLPAGSPTGPRSTG